MINEKYKILQVSLDGDTLNVPIINDSYVYTLWVLKHKYKIVRLHNIINISYTDKVTNNIIVLGKATFNTEKEINVNTPNINPIIDIENIDSVIIGLGIDAYLILHGTLYDKVIHAINKNFNLLDYSTCSNYFDNYIIKLQIHSDKIQGIAPKLHGVPYYKYTSKKRKAFNRRAEYIRKLLGKETNIKKKKQQEYVEEILTPAMREYYESQLHDFVYTYIYKGEDLDGE